MDEYVEGLVSCIIPSYKRCDTVIRAIDSVLNQTYNNIEICVVDDNTPNSECSINLQKKLSKYKNNCKVIYLRQDKHINGAAARNYGIKHSKGEFIAFLDDDDEWMPNKIERELEMINEKMVDGISCLYGIYKNGTLIRNCHPYNADDIHKKILSREVAVFTSTVMMRRKAVFNTNLFNVKLKRHQDLQFLLDFVYKNSFCVLNEYLVKINSDHEINKPNTKGFINVKNNFFDNCKTHLMIYDKDEQGEILSAHYFEIILMAIKEYKIKYALKYLMKIGLNVGAYKKLLLRWKKR